MYAVNYYYYYCDYYYYYCEDPGRDKRLDTRPFQQYGETCARTMLMVLHRVL